ncbi:MAG: hypothetical protein ACR2II_13290 [Chthoniobacterales bacterium]
MPGHNPLYGSLGRCAKKFYATDSSVFMLSHDDFRERDRLGGAIELSSKPAWQKMERASGLLETSVPGIFAAGDVRAGSVKRCAAAVGEGGMAVAGIHAAMAESADAKSAEREKKVIFPAARERR